MEDDQESSSDSEQKRGLLERLASLGAPVWLRFGAAVALIAMFVGGAIRIAQEQDAAPDGYALLTIAVFLTGVWVTVELHDKFSDEKHRKDDDEHSAG